jgi:hypothetical protein
LNANQIVSLPVPNSIADFLGQFTFPDFSAIKNFEVWKIAVVLAIVAILETLLSVEATDKLDPDKRITIIFSEDKIITPEITDEGAFMLIQTYHYFHEGRFSDADNIEFSVTGLGGLGGGLNYYVSGKRK